MKIRGEEALEQGKKNRGFSSYPSKKDPRHIQGINIPNFKAGFRLKPDSKIFTIGSCFARNIEEKLTGYNLPTTVFSVPKEEWEHRPNGLLNEYNPGTMAQRILWATDAVDTARDIGSLLIDIKKDQAKDLLLPKCPLVSSKRAFERRREIDTIYRELPTSDILIMTLGLNECWFDNETGLYLNRMPDPKVMKLQKDRFEFHRLGPDRALELLAPAFEKLIDSGLRNIILTVSPVPLVRTFSGDDAVMANCYSKSTLRVVSEQLRTKFKGHIDYFPSYEMVTSAGPRAFVGDNIHVDDTLVGIVTSYMLSRYLDKD